MLKYCCNKGQSSKGCYTESNVSLRASDTVSKSECQRCENVFAGEAAVVCVFGDILPHAEQISREGCEP